MNNLKIILTFVLQIMAVTAHATPSNISSHQYYKESVNLIEKLGRKEVIKQIVRMQRKQLRDYGGALDDYTTVTGVTGGDYGLRQNIKIDVDKVLSDYSQSLIGKEKRKMSKEDVYQMIKKDGVIYELQVNTLCSSPSTRGVIDSGINYVNDYYDPRMNYIGEIDVGKSICLSFDLHE
ncbi:hypothetical protein [Endozoicomonas sp. ALB115]|uniref:hypothetical protein n=1 Tax=Endozoicomonas sp. ALB115 TaxID=3403074 RepID=UPI003BB77808